mmetsp:Transcript_103405/g.211091  ORF Transcript_103405/g.211091 Transcript_103405/m.211091 type:complete len:296 (+) Transcript_103405:1355-2242(+)
MDRVRLLRFVAGAGCNRIRGTTWVRLLRVIAGVNDHRVRCTGGLSSNSRIHTRGFQTRWHRRIRGRVGKNQFHRGEHEGKLSWGGEGDLEISFPVVARAAVAFVANYGVPERCHVAAELVRPSRVWKQIDQCQVDDGCVVVVATASTVHVVPFHRWRRRRRRHLSARQGRRSPRRRTTTSRHRKPLCDPVFRHTCLSTQWGPHKGASNTVPAIIVAVTTTAEQATVYDRAIALDQGLRSFHKGVAQEPCGGTGSGHDQQAVGRPIEAVDGRRSAQGVALVVVVVVFPGGVAVGFP